MILLDTNIVSELMRPDPAVAVTAWFSCQSADSVFITAVTAAELWTGVLLMPTGKRRDGISLAVQSMIDRTFRDQVLPFDGPSARFYAEIFAGRRAAGRPVSVQDVQIAATARANRIPLATRNIHDFEDTGIELVDPWTAGIVANR